MPKCQECGREFATDTALLQHLKDKHGTEGTPPEGRAVGGEKERREVKKQKTLRRSNRHTRAYALVAVAVALGIGVYYVAAPVFAGPPFPCITGESWIHIHPYLTIDIEGRNVTIPQGVGAVEGGSCLEPVHTHDSSGILHIELTQSDAQGHNYTLGDFFSIWNYTVKSGAGAAPTLDGATLPVAFSSTDIFGYTTNSTHRVVLLVDGQPSTQWGSLNLEQLDYCSASNTAPPCGNTGDPLWKGGTSDPYGVGHTIVIEYVKG